MTARFDAFKAALDALCKEHGVRLYYEWDDWGDRKYATTKAATRGAPAGLHLDLDECIPPPPPTPEQRKAAAALKRAERARRDAWAKTAAARHLRIINATDYEGWQKVIDADAAQQRAIQMRVSTDPTDPAYIDARPRKAWCNGVLIEGWTVADEFRRCVITPDKVFNGSVLVERLERAHAPRFTRLPAEDTTEHSAWHDHKTNCLWLAPPNTDPNEAPVEEPAPEPINSMSGMFVNVPAPQPAPVAEPAPAPKPKPTPAPIKKRRR